MSSSFVPTNLQITTLPPLMQQQMQRFKTILPQDKYAFLEDLMHNTLMKRIPLHDFQKQYYELILPYTRFDLQDTLLQHVQSNTALFDRIAVFQQADPNTRMTMLGSDPELSTTLIQYLNMKRTRIAAERASQRLKTESAGAVPVERSADEKVAEYEGQSHALQKLSLQQLVSLKRRLEQSIDAVQEEIVKKQKEEEAEKQGMLCMICMSARKNVLFFPCMHVSICDKCPGQKTCCLCRTKIEKSVKIFV